MGGISAPQFHREWDWNVGSITAGLSMEIDDGGAPVSAWFELGTNADLSGCSIVGDQSQTRGYGGLQQHAELSDLTPGTTYYYRANAQTVLGKVTGPVQSFTTAAASAPPPPDIQYQDASLQVMNGGLGWMFTFVGNGHGLSGTMTNFWSTDPNMAGATAGSSDGLIAGPTGQCTYLFLPCAQFPNSTTVYVQATVQTSAGEAKSAVGNAVMHS